MHNTGVTVHMVVKNEDQWVWYAINSVLPYADHILITDTGSTDNTVTLIQSINSPKITFQKKIASTPAAVTAIRQEQIAMTKTPWMWVVDGDEIYGEDVAQQVVKMCHEAESDIVLVRRYDLLGDIYHRQVESVGTYRLFGHTGHLLIRCVCLAAFPGLHYGGDYPNEGLFTGEGKSLLEHDPSRVAVTDSALYHAMYLKRSSRGANLPMFNRSKYKIETGVSIGEQYPKVFDRPRPKGIADARAKRSIAYEVAAHVITPVKNLKRAL